MTGLVALSMASSLAFTYAPVLRNISSGFRVIILTLAGAGAAALIRPVDENNPAGTSADENAEREKTLL